MTTSPQGIAALVGEYRALRIKWSSDLDIWKTSRRVDRLLKRSHKVALKLNGSPEGRAGLERLLDDANPGVRVGAASEAIAWGSHAAIATLQSEADGEGITQLPPGPCWPSVELDD